MAVAASSLKLAGQRVLVTGSGRGIGRAIAIICHKHGAKVAITSRTESELMETKSQMVEITSKLVCEDKDLTPSNRILAQTADATNAQEVESLVDTVVSEWGGIDILINNAGRGQSKKGPTESLDIADLEAILQTNVVAVQRITSCVVSKAMVPQSSGGRIINISSKAGKVGIPNIGFYAASKFALEGLTATWATELEKYGILVNSISPGMVDTVGFPKAKGKPGIRSAESIEDTLMMLLSSSQSGQYVHVDEYDEVRKRSLPEEMALKPINEPDFADWLSDKTATNK